MAWIETAGVVVLCALGALVGRALSRMPGRRWIAGPAAGFVLMAMLTLPRRYAALAFVPPFSWLTAGRLEFAVLGPAVTFVLAGLIIRLPSRRTRVLLAGFAVLAASYFSVLPFALPGLMKGRFLRLDTQVDGNGVCLQNTPYTCGPAAAVTALGLLGITAEEGEIAVLAGTTPLTGTECDTLAAALAKRFGAQGLRCRYRRFDRVDDLCSECPAVVTVKCSFLVDHYVTVLDISGGKITIGDPLLGKREEGLEEFERFWRRVGIVMKRTGDGH